MKVSIVLYFQENPDNFEARTTRVSFRLFGLNSDFTWPNLTLESPVFTQQIRAWKDKGNLLYWDNENSALIFDKITQCERFA